MPIYNFSDHSEEDLMDVLRSVTTIDRIIGAVMPDGMLEEIKAEVRRKRSHRIVIVVESHIQSTGPFEEIEDELARVMAKWHLVGYIDDGVTGNTTRFPKTKEE